MKLIATNSFTDEQKTELTKWVEHLTTSHPPTIATLNRGKNPIVRINEKHPDKGLHGVKVIIHGTDSAQALTPHEWELLNKRHVEQFGRSLDDAANESQGG